MATAKNYNIPTLQAFHDGWSHIGLFSRVLIDGWGYLPFTCAFLDFFIKYNDKALIHDDHTMYRSKMQCSIFCLFCANSWASSLIFSQNHKISLHGVFCFPYFSQACYLHTIMNEDPVSDFCKAL